MAITTYAEVQDAIGNWLNRAAEFGDGGTAVARTKEWIELAEHRIANDPDLRIRAMETSADLTVDAQEVALPTRFVSARRIYIDGDPIRRLEYLSPQNFWAKYMSSETSKPKAFTIEGENFVFGPSPDTTYTGKVLYWARFEALSDSNTSNWLTTNAADLLFYGALVDAGLFLKDPSTVAAAAGMYDDAKSRIMRANRLDRHSGDAMIARPDFQGL